MRRMLIAGFAGALLFAASAGRAGDEGQIYTTPAAGSVQSGVSSAGEPCGKVGSVDRLTVERGGRARWLVVTGCQARTKVEITGFAPGSTKTCEGPVTVNATPCANDNLKATVGQLDHAYIKCKIPKEAPLGCWTYRVKVNGVMGPDPELEVREPRKGEPTPTPTPTPPVP